MPRKAKPIKTQWYKCSKCRDLFEADDMVYITIGSLEDKHANRTIVLCLDCGGELVDFISAYFGKEKR